MSDVVSMLSVDEVERLLSSYEDKYEDSGWHLWDEYVPFGDKLSEPVEVERLGPVQLVSTYTGGEGGGEDAELIFKIGDRYFRKGGYYASHDGTYWDGDFSEVRPEPKTITVYIAV